MLQASPKASPKVSGATSPSKTPLSPSKLGHSPKKGSSGSSGSPSKTGLPAPLISPRPPAEVVKCLGRNEDEQYRKDSKIDKSEAGEDGKDTKRQLASMEDI